MLCAKQSHIFSRFSYDIFDSASNKVGVILWPDLATANNARLKDLVPKSFSTNLKVEINGRVLTIEFEYLNRDWFNDIRFILKEGGEILASADVKQKKWASVKRQLLLDTDDN